MKNLTDLTQITEAEFSDRLKLEDPETFFGLFPLVQCNFNMHLTIDARLTDEGALIKVKSCEDHWFDIADNDTNPLTAEVSSDQVTTYYAIDAPITRSEIFGFFEALV